MNARFGYWLTHPAFKRLPDHYFRHRMELEKTGERVNDEPQKGLLLDYYIADTKTLRMYASGLFIEPFFKFNANVTF